MRKFTKTCGTVVFIFLVIILLSNSPALAVPRCPYCLLAEDDDRVLMPQEPAMQGRDVDELQLILKDIGRYHGSVSGIYDSSTIEAVKKFQLSRGLEPNGVVEDTTWQELDEAQYLLVLQNKVQSPNGEVSIITDTYRRKLTVLSDGEPYKQYPIAVGKPETPTPIGTFKVLRRARNWGTGFGTRWIGLTIPWGLYGIHGTNKPYAIGSYASHGCIRMNNQHVEEIYPWINPGTVVTIIGNPFQYNHHKFRTLRRDNRGSDVMEVQIRLKKLGFYEGPIDGIWGGGMERAVLDLRKKKGLSRDNAIDDKVYHLLGL